MTRAQTTAFLTPGLIWLSLFLLLPCLLLLINALLGDDGALTAERFQAVVAPENRALLYTSLKLAGLATLCALVFGCPAAWAIALAPKRRQPLLLLLVLLPFLAGTFLTSTAWALLLRPDGFAAALLRSLGLAPGELLGQRWTVVLGLVASTLPFVVLAVFASLRRQDPALREASTDLGASRWRTFRRISLPLSLPGVLQGALFVFALSLGNFLVPDLLADRAVPTLGTEIYDRFVTRPDWTSGSALAALPVACMLLLLLAQALLATKEPAR